MALIATAVGFELDEDGNEVFTVKLMAETHADIPKLTAADVWAQTPLLLTRAAEAQP